MLRGYHQIFSSSTHDKYVEALLLLVGICLSFQDWMSQGVSDEVESSTREEYLIWKEETTRLALASQSLLGYLLSSDECDEEAKRTYVSTELHYSFV